MPEVPDIYVIAAWVLGSYCVLAAFFLYIGSALKKRFPSASSSTFSATVHVAAMFGFIVGATLAWMAYDSDHPLKERHLWLPILLPLLVYGAVALFWLKSYGFTVVKSMLSAMFSRPKG